VLALEEAIVDARRADGARGVVDLLVSVLTDPRISDDAQIDRYLDALKSACRQTGRYQDAMAVFDRIAELNPARRHEMMAERALAHAHRRERSAGTAILRTALAEQRRLPAAQRDTAFNVVAELAALALQQPELARRAASLRKTTMPAASR
jgi:tetratricopeptide (TPR) repeat protein